jgi:hypothetical protein
MRLGAALLAFAVLCAPALAQDRGTRIAMAVALLDVAEEHCAGQFRVDASIKKKLMAHFHEYDIAGLASLLSQPLNAFYEDFAYEAKREPEAFCRRAPGEAATTGYPVILAGQP